MMRPDRGANSTSSWRVSEEAAAAAEEEEEEAVAEDEEDGEERAWLRLQTQQVQSTSEAEHRADA